MRRVREIGPILRERVQASEEARRLTRENEQLLRLFRFHQPMAFAGMELDFVPCSARDLQSPLGFLFHRS